MSDARGELQLDNAGVNQLYELIRKERYIITPNQR